MTNKTSHKRLNYYTGQLLNADDFKDEQLYHVDTIRSHNRNLHTWGIARGLNVEKIGTKNVTISRGMAIDGKGRQMVLDELREIDLSQSTASSLYLIISYQEEQTDFREGEGDKAYTRISEECVIEYDTNEPDELSMKIILAKLIFDREKDTLSYIDLEERRNVKNIGGDIEVKSIDFSLPTKEYSDKFPRIKGVDGGNPGLEIISENTALKGNLDVSGTITGKLSKNMVGTDQIEQRSVPISRMSTIQSSGTAEIGPKSEAKVDFTEPGTKHHFFMTSVIPITQNSTIEWWWKVEKGDLRSIRFNKEIDFLKKIAIKSKQKTIKLMQKLTHLISRKGKSRTVPSQESIKKADLETVPPSAQKQLRYQKIVQTLGDEKNKFSYVLVVKNFSNKKIEVEFKYYEILE
ncbi:MAG TPA: hypothetical protein VMW20_01870 [Candidatus Nanoarchaeia archaeon]|nr:hypothetical protein [Candidatus Nanoarchaeia archaeon]